MTGRSTTAEQQSLDLAAEPVAAPSEAEIKRDILVYLGALCPRVIAHNHPTGVAVAEGGRTIAFGLVGSGDVLACAWGRWLEIEVKSRRGAQSKQQELREAAVRRAGGVYVVARSVEDVRAAIARLAP